MKTFLATIVLLFAYTLVYAQHCTLQGRIVAGRTPLQDAGVFLLSGDGTERAAVVTDSLGYFHFEALTPGGYLIRVRLVGFRQYETSFTVKGKMTDIGTVSLSAADNILKEVVVSAAPLPMIQKHDTTEYAAGAYKLAENASAAALIRKLPGITANGKTVKMQGEEVVNIFVDGKPFFTGDPYAALAILPAGMIDKVQVYRDKQPEEQVSGFSEKPATPVINLVIKQNRKHSMFGNAYGGTGTQARYLAGATANAFSGERRISSIVEANNIHAGHYTTDQLPGMADNSMLDAKTASVNYTDKWKNVELAGTYGYSRNVATTETRQDRHYTQATDSGAAYYGRDKRTGTTDGHNLTMTLDYHADSFNSLQVRPQWGWQQNKTMADITGTMQQQGITTGAAMTHNYATVTASSIAADALYMHKWRNARRSFTLGAGYKYNSNQSDLAQMVHNGVPVTDSMYQQTGMHATERCVTANAAYAIPAGKAGQVQLQYDISNVYASSDKNNYSSADPGQQGGVPHATVFNRFNNTVLTQKAGVFYRLRKSRADVSLGVFGQQAMQTLQQQEPVAFSVTHVYRNILPVLSAQYYFSPGRTWQLMYMPNAAQPEISQLQPLTDKTNSLLLYTGNTALKQVYQHNVSLRYTGMNTAKRVNYFLLLSGSYAHNYIGNSIFFAGRDTLISPGVVMRQGAQLMQPVNVDGYSYLNITAGYGFPLWKLHVDINMNGNMVHVPVVINGIINRIKRQGIGADVSVSSNISSNIDLTCSSNNTCNIAAGASVGSGIYYTNNSNLLLNLTLPMGFLVNMGASYRFTKAPGTGNTDDALLCNLGIGKQLWQERAQARVLVYDCTGQNKNIAQFVTDTYTEQVWRSAIERYIMLVFTCNFHRYK